MAKILDVYFHEKIVGELKQNDDGQIEFTYLPSWLEHPDTIAISCSLPLQQATFKRKECRAFFAGILPEESQRKLIARNLGISANNDFTMLERIGGECAGAITFVPSGQGLQLTNASYHELTEKELANMLRELPYRPLLAGEEGVRLSLAGVQDKMAVCVKAGKISIPLYGAPSTHILKPAIGTFDGVIFNEAFCLELGRKVNLPTAKAEIRKIEDIDYLLVERYDRQKMNDLINFQEVKRLHQEDFCQALGIVSEKKYQNEGGPSFQQCFNLLREVSAIPVVDLDRFIDVIIFNVLIGNCDAHGKNFSLLYQSNIRLAPFYDLVSTLYYKNLSSKMAMKLGGEYNADKITIKNFENLAEEASLSKQGVRGRVFELIESIMGVLEEIEIHNQVEQEISQLIKMRCFRLLKG
jgi:serine/threonine-protein kinase HipA